MGLSESFTVARPLAVVSEVATGVLNATTYLAFMRGFGYHAFSADKGHWIDTAEHIAALPPIGTVVFARDRGRFALTGAFSETRARAAAAQRHTFLHGGLHGAVAAYARAPPTRPAT